MRKIPLHLALSAFVVSLSSTVQAQWVQQSFTLRPGWNAVFLDVQPEAKECKALFSGLAVESVWDFNPTLNSPQFVQDPTTLLPGAPGWLTWFPTNHPLAAQGNLFILRDGRPYLIKLADNASPVTWTVTGRPSLRTTTWRPGGVNFVGFRVGTNGPTFQSLFAGEAGLTGQPVYTLNTNGSWQQVANLAVTRPEPGRAYWVRCISPAQRTGTIEVDAGSRRGLDFVGDSSELELRLRNTSTAARNLVIRVLPSTTPPVGHALLAGGVPLDYWRTDYTNAQIGWARLPTNLNFVALPAGAEQLVRLGVHRSDDAGGSPGSRYQSILEVTDDLGTRWLVPVAADISPGATAGARGPRNGGPSPMAGLWIGNAVIDAVSQPAHASDPNLPRPVSGRSSFRLIVHVDTNGTARLVQHAYVVRKPPTYVPDPQNPGYNIIDQPARFVVFTDESLITPIIGPGEIVGRRVSSAAFGFSQPLVLSGGAFGDGTLNCAVTMDFNHPLNPFKHVYHPDHDNLDEQFAPTLPQGKESFTVVRNVTLEFTADDPQGLNPPGWGDTELGGIYREAIGGLHRRTIYTAGNFRLARVSQTPGLNQ